MIFCLRVVTDADMAGTKFYLLYQQKTLVSLLTFRRFGGMSFLARATAIVSQGMEGGLQGEMLTTIVSRPRERRRTLCWHAHFRRLPLSEKVISILNDPQMQG